MSSGFTSIFYASAQEVNWQNITLLNGWTGTLKYKNFLGEIFLLGDIIPGTTTDGTTIGNLPTNLGPSLKITSPITAQSAGSTLTTIDSARATIETDGTIKIYGFGTLASNPVSINITWPL